MSKDNSGPAFPCTPEHAVRMNGEGGSGMSLRDYFAAKALQGLISGAMADGSNWDEGAETLLPKVAYKIADGMLFARSA